MNYLKQSCKTTWGRGHWRWLTQQVMEHPAQQIVLQEYLDAVREAGARVQRLTGQKRPAPLGPENHLSA